MSDTSNKNVDFQNLKSDDPALRRETAERYFSEEIPDENLEAFCELIRDSDAGVRDAVISALISNTNSLIPSYVVKYTTSKESINTRNFAGEILIKRGSTSIKAMIKFLTDGQRDDDDEKFLIDILGLIGDKEPAEQIISALQKTENDNVKLACLEALGNIKCDEATKDIISWYDVDENFKPTIIESLGKIGSEDAVNFILEKYHDVDDLTKFSMIESLGLVGNTQAFFLLLSELRNLSGALTWAAIESLKKLRDKFQLDVPFDESMKNAILNTLVDGERNHKRAAAHLLAAFNDKELVEACLNIYNSDEEIDYVVKTKFFENPKFLYPKIAEFLKQKPNNLKALFELLKEMIQNDGGESLLGISEFDRRNLSDAFTQNFDHPDEEVRRSAIELLFFMDAEVALMFLDTMVQDDDMWNRLRVLEIMENFNDERCAEAAKLLVDDSDEMVSEKAKQILSSYEQ